MFAMTDPKEHSARRKVFAQGFANTSILKFEEVVKEKAQVAISKIKRDAEQDVADIFKWFTFMATDVAGQLSFGTSFEMLEQEDVNKINPMRRTRKDVTRVLENSLHPGFGDHNEDIWGEGRTGLVGPFDELDAG